MKTKHDKLVYAIAETLHDAHVQRAKQIYPTYGAPYFYQEDPAFQNELLGYAALIVDCEGDPTTMCTHIGAEPDKRNIAYFRSLIEDSGYTITLKEGK